MRVCLLLLIAIGVVLCSRGDSSSDYRSCTDVCRSRFSCPEAFSSLGWGGVDCFRCRYNCVWRTVDSFQRFGEPVPQFHGKWPFLALDLGFLVVQEPASVVFSIGNLIGMLVMLDTMRRSDLQLGKRMWMCYSVVGVITWICSSLFHVVDVWLTEYLDYFSACGFVFSALYVSAHVVFLKLSITSEGRLTSRLLGFSLLLFYLRHIFNLSNHFDYGWNMTCCVAASVATTLLYLFHLVSRFARFSKFSRSDRLLLKMILLGNGSVLLELLDFPPLFWLLDAHSLFHLATIPLPFLYTQFLLTLQDEYVVVNAAKNV